MAPAQRVHQAQRGEDVELVARRAVSRSGCEFVERDQGSVDGMAGLAE
jgi:hypothetical protein